ncbi:hypothetical protein HANVADRAFT_51808 [Hanseniaspora valbyensis NRRL Y-1626]|uniref:DUF913 domain-containing protein n=1 Tax=Hanseniaspora valbyensis NRRL Y-1626 TaxID=766949 RepID=A0A1B7TH85_9ASCO|nr:hypothetical protein HANVADRAFT_51808 [Hanseniaspora valbyensis NRRL Y-1626]
MAELRPYKINNPSKASRNENVECYVGLMNSFLDIEDDQEFVSKLKNYQKQEWLRGPDDIFVWIPVLDRLNNLFKNIAEKHHLNISIPDLKGNNDNIPLSRKNSNASNSTFDSNASSNSFDSASDSSSGTSDSDISRNNNDIEDDMKVSYDAFLTQLPKDTETFILDMINFILFLLENTTKSSVDSSVDGILGFLNVPNMEIKLGCIKVLSILSLRSLKSYSGNQLLQKDIMKKSSIIIFSLLCSTPTETGEDTNFSLFEFLTKISSKPFDLFEDNELIIPESNFLPFSFEYYSEKNDCSEIFKLDKETIMNTSYDDLLSLVKQQNLIPEHYWFKISIELYLVKTFATTKNKLNLKNDAAEIKKIFDLLNPFVQLKFYSVGFTYFSIYYDDRDSLVFLFDENLLNCLGKLTFSGYSLEKEREELSLQDIIHSSLFALECISKEEMLLENINKHLFGNASYSYFTKLLERIRIALVTGKNIDTKYNVQFFSLLENHLWTFSDFSVNSDIVDKLTKILIIPDCKDYTTLCGVSKVLDACMKKSDSRTAFENAGGYTFLKTILNKEVLNIIQTLLNKDIVFFEILQEAGTISMVLDNFQGFVGPLSDLLLLLPNVVSTICLNKDGLQKVISKNILQYLFEPLKNVELAKNLLYGTDRKYVEFLDKLYNDYPELQKCLEDEFLNVLDEFDRGEYGKNLFMEDKNGNYFDSNSENWNTKKIPDSLACVYDYTNVGILNKMIMITLRECCWIRVIQNLNTEFVLKSIFKEGIPFSFELSEMFSAITDVINDTYGIIPDDPEDDYSWNREKTLNFFMENTNNCLQNMTEFLNYDNQKSFFLNTSKKKILKVSNSLNLLNSVLNFFLNNLINYGDFFCLRVLLEGTDKDNEKEVFTTFLLLEKLFTKILRENTLLQDSLLPQQDADTTPMRGRFIDIRKDKSLDNNIFKESFLNNIFMVRTWFNGIQFNTVFLFRALLKIESIKEKALDSIDNFNKIENMETVMVNVINILNFLVEEGEVHEILLRLHYLENILLKNNIFYKEKDKCIEFPTASLFYRFKGNELLFKIVIKMVSLMASRVDIVFIDIRPAKIYNNDIKSIPPLVLHSCLNLLTWTTKIEKRELEQTQFEELFKNIAIDSSTYCDELIFQTKTLNSFELKKLSEKENLLQFILNKDRKLTDNSLISILDFILSMVDIKEIISDNKDIPFLHSGYTKYFQAFREAIQRPDEITDDDLWEKVYEHLVYSYENDQSCKLELILDADKYTSSLKTLTDNIENFRSMSLPLVSTYYPKDVNKTNNLLLNNVKSFLSNTETTNKIDIKCELLKLYPNCTTKIEEFHETINDLLTKK